MTRLQPAPSSYSELKADPAIKTTAWRRILHNRRSGIKQKPEHKTGREKTRGPSCRKAERRQTPLLGQPPSKRRASKP